MKRLLSYLYITFIFLGCGKFTDANSPRLTIDDDLIYIDSLMQLNPDAALQMIQSCQYSKDEFNENYHSLLLSEVLYKMSMPLTNKAELQSAMQYFDSLYTCHQATDDLALYSARAHYMNGVGYYESDSVVNACKEYIKTLMIMESHFYIDKLTNNTARLMALTHTRLGELFSYYGSTQATLDSYKKALIYFSKVENYSLANTYRRIAGSYHSDNNNDSSLYYYRKAINLAKKQNKMSVYSNALSEAAYVYYELDYTDSAFMMIRKALQLPVSEDRRLAQYFTYGLLLANENQYDSAIYYLEKSIERNYYVTQAVSAELLMNCYEALGDTIKMLYYKTLYGNNFTQYRNTSTIETSLAKTYADYQQSKSQRELLKSIKQRNIRIIIISILIISTVIGIAIIIWKKIFDVKKKLKYDIAEKDKALAKMKLKIETNPFVNEPICKSILDVVNIRQFKSKVHYSTYKEFALNKNQLLMLREAVNKHYDNFTQTLTNRYPELTIDDIDYCCLYFLGLKDADISALMQRAYPTVCQRSRKLKRIFNSNESIQTTIASLTFPME